jgi:hypothetical protein
MARDVLKAQDGSRVEVDRGESSVITVTFTDANGGALNKDAIQTLKLTLRNAENNSIINGRNAQSVYDENGGSLSTNGTLTLILSPEDNSIYSPVTPGRVESHYATFSWTYTDSSNNPMVGKHQFEILVSECVG